MKKQTIDAINIDIEPTIYVKDKQYTLEEFNQIVDYLANVLELNENQQIVFDWLKDNVLQDGTSAMCSVFQFGTLWEMRRFNDQEAIRVDNAYCELNNDEQFQVLAAFAEWGGMKNEQ